MLAVEHRLRIALAAPGDIDLVAIGSTGSLGPVTSSRASSWPRRSRSNGTAQAGGALVNPSCNGRGEPIVSSTPTRRGVRRLGVDFLLLEGELVGCDAAWRRAV